MGKWFYILAVAAVLLSCSKEIGGGSDGPGDFPYPESSMAVGFSADGEWNLLSKALADPSVTGFETGDVINVFGYYRQQGQALNSVAPNFMYAQPVVFDGTNWNYSPIKYWPNNDGDKLDFYAYFPIENNITVSPNTQAGPPVLNYETKELGHSQVDFLYAIKEDLAKPASDEKTELVFKHLLGKLQFFVSVLPPDGAKDESNNPITVNEGLYSAYIKSVSYTINTHGTFRYTLSDDLPEWDVTPDKTKELIHTIDGKGELIDSGGEKTVYGQTTELGEYVHEFTSFLLPVTINKLTVSLSSDGGITHTDKEITLTGSDIIQITAGKVTTVKLKIQQGKVVTMKILVKTTDWYKKTIDPVFPIE